MPSETFMPVNLPPSIVNDISYYDHTWATWTTGSSSTSAGNVVVDGNVVWGVWTSSGTGSYTPIDVSESPPENPDAARNRQELLERQRREASAREEMRRKSERKALELLRASLTPDQRKQFYESSDNYFDVEITDPRMTLLVKKLRMRVVRFGEVREIEEDGTIHNTYCIGTPPNIPLYDAMLAKKLMLECHPEDFFRIANRHAWIL